MSGSLGVPRACVGEEFNIATKAQNDYLRLS
jgi:hypothetical protein